MTNFLAARGDESSFSHRNNLVVQDSRSTRLNTILELIDSEKHYLTDLIEVREVGLIVHAT